MSLDPKYRPIRAAAFNLFSDYYGTIKGVLDFLQSRPILCTFVNANLLRRAKTRQEKIWVDKTC